MQHFINTLNPFGLILREASGQVLRDGANTPRLLRTNGRGLYRVRPEEARRAVSKGERLGWSKGLSCDRHSERDPESSFLEVDSPPASYKRGFAGMTASEFV